MSDNVVPIAIPGSHERFFPFFKKNAGSDAGIKVLEVGAGHGAFTKKLYEAGYHVAACDLFPEIFRFDKVECKRGDLTFVLPYDTASMDVIVAIEVMEHILDHEVFFKECRRILKRGGKLLFSTPNVLSMKSRMRYFLTGFYYSFHPLDIHNNDGLQHVCSMTFDQYRYAAGKNGLELHDFSYDKTQGTSQWLAVIFYPLLWLFSKKWKMPMHLHNQWKLLTGRSLYMAFRKP